MNLQILEDRVQEIEKAVRKLREEIRREKEAGSEDLRPVLDANRLPMGGYKAGWLSPKQLRREVIYEEG